MALDVGSIQASPAPPKDGQRPPFQESAAQPEPGRPVPSPPPKDLGSAIRDLQRVSEAFNRRLSFSLNEKLGQVVVKVIDNDTDRVVREIPPTELQRVYERIREVIGLLFDKSA